MAAMVAPRNTSIDISREDSFCSGAICEGFTAMEASGTLARYGLAMGGCEWGSWQAASGHRIPNTRAAHGLIIYHFRARLFIPAVRTAIIRGNFMPTLISQPTRIRAAGT